MDTFALISDNVVRCVIVADGAFVSANGVQAAAAVGFASGTWMNVSGRDVGIDFVFHPETNTFSSSTLENL